MKTAEVITHGAVQSVVLPTSIRIAEGEVFVKQLGRSVMLIPKGDEAWKLFLEGLDSFTTDYMEDRGQPQQQSREELFD
jgi:antitoxin VapB